MATGKLLVLLLLATVRSHRVFVDGGCVAAPERVQLQCSGVDAAYFQRLRPNGTHWIRCSDCALPVIDARTFPYARNNLSYLEVGRSRTVSLRKRAFGSLYLLKGLSLRGNRIEYLELQCFDGLQRLLQLDLSLNFLQQLGADAFAELRSLDLLNLSRNQLATLHPQAFAGLDRLQYLYLNHNALLRLQERSFRPLASLKILYVEHNGLLEIHQNAFVGLAKLQYLYLNNNSIDFLVQYNFRPLAGLLELQLRSNRLREVQVSAFNGLRSLRVLHLADNQIAHIKPYGFIGLDGLRVLDLVRNRLPQVTLAHFDKMPHLHVLWLNDNPIVELVFSGYDEPLEAMEVLDLSGSGLRVFDHARLYRNMPNIKELVLANCSLECEFFAHMFAYYSAANVTVCLTSGCSPDGNLAYSTAICQHSESGHAPTPPSLPAGATPLPPLPLTLCAALLSVIAVY